MLGPPSGPQPFFFLVFDVLAVIAATSASRSGTTPGYASSAGPSSAAFFSTAHARWYQRCAGSPLEEKAFGTDSPKRSTPFAIFSLHARQAARPEGAMPT